MSGRLRLHPYLDCNAFWRLMRSRELPPVQRKSDSGFRSAVASAQITPFQVVFTLISNGDKDSVGALSEITSGRTSLSIALKSFLPLRVLGRVLTGSITPGVICVGRGTVTLSLRKNTSMLPIDSSANVTKAAGILDSSRGDWWACKAASQEAR